MKTTEFKVCPENFNGVRAFEWNEHIKWMMELIQSYENKPDKEARIQRLIDRFPEYVK